MYYYYLKIKTHVKMVNKYFSNSPKLANKIQGPIWCNGEQVRGPRFKSRSMSNNFVHYLKYIIYITWFHLHLGVDQEQSTIGLVQC